MNVAIIPARGGSQRLPRKNIRPFAGKPVIAYSIDKALQSGLFGRVIVSTDDAEIAEVARRHGAEAPFLRPAALADDHTGTAAVVRHALEWLREKGEIVSRACCLYATSPLVRVRDLQDGLARLTASGRAYVFTVARFPSAIQRALRIHADGGIEPFWPENTGKRTQDLEPAYFDAGQFYWGRADAFLAGVPIHSPHSVALEIPRSLAQDIDTADDWEMAELMYRALGAGRE